MIDKHGPGESGSRRAFADFFPALLLAVSAILIALITEPAVGQESDPPESVMPEPSQVIARFAGGEITGASLEEYILSLPVPQRRPSDAEDLVSWQRRVTERLVLDDLFVVDAKTSGLFETDSFRRSWQRARRRILAEAMLAQASAEMPVIGPEEVEAYYQEHQDRFRRNEAILTRHIFLRGEEGSPEREKQRKQLEKIRDEITAGADFAEMAKRFSDSENASEGGLLPWQRRATLHPAYEEAAWKLGPGELSPIVETEWGYHLIQMEDRQEEGIAPLSEVAARIEQQLKAEALRKAEEDLIADLAAQMGLESATPVIQARRTGKDEILAQAALRKGLDQSAEVESQLRNQWRRMGVEAARSHHLNAWARTIDEEDLRLFYAEREGHYQTPLEFDLFVVEVLFQDGVPQMETKLAAEKCSSLMKAGRVDEATNRPGVRAFHLEKVTPQALVRHSSRSLVQEIRDLAPGDVSQPLRYEKYNPQLLRYEPLGYWIVRADNVISPRKRPYEAVRDRVRRDYVSRHQATFNEELKKRLFEEFHVEILIGE